MKTKMKTIALVLLIGFGVAGTAKAQAQIHPGVLPTQPSHRYGPKCSHVIDLMTRAQFGGKLAPAIMPGPYGPVIVQPQVGDLKLCSVQLICEATAECGPKFAVTIHNNSQHAVQCFHVSLVAVLCKIDCHDPTTTIKVDCLKACETVTLEITLPQTALAMHTCDQKLAEFDTLVVAIDAYDEFLECDERNNIQVLKRGEIAAVAVEVPAAEAPVAPAPNVDGALPNGNLPEATLPSEVKKPTPLDNIDLDQLQLDGDDAATTGINW